MSRISHYLYLSILSFVVVIVTISLVLKGNHYYIVILTERFFHTDHQILKPSGDYGHAYGIFGALLMILGIVSYMVRKRFRFVSRLGVLKHWLEFHIFLCVLGPLLILFHTSFKIGGLVAISFWSMVAVFLSGIIGRFIYIQIPHTIEGRELSLNEVRALKVDVGDVLRETTDLDENSYHSIVDLLNAQECFNPKNIFFASIYRNQKYRRTLREIKRILKRNKLSKTECVDILRILKNDMSLSQKIARLKTMQNLFRYWHVAHLPFALVMIIVMLIHVIVTILLGYKWIF